MTKTDEDLIAAARAVVERWDTPHWKDVPATAVFINRLRNALCDRLEGRGGGEVVALPDGRDMCGETVMGMRVAAYRQPIRCPPDVDPATFEEFFRRGKPNTYSEHWSTPGAGLPTERLFLEADVRAALSREGEGWREIESAPTDGRSVLVFCPRAPDHGYERIRLTWRKDGKWQGANNTSWPPTHWMPLPAPPSQGGE